MKIKNGEVYEREGVNSNDLFFDQKNGEKITWVAPTYHSKWFEYWMVKAIF